ncbi:MAG TPA: DUF2182 domain-containing protein [Gaiellaceae bacterium]|nr:DUF2182 domain-containing protein [Gaiellaceae bacterium]
MTEIAAAPAAGHVARARVPAVIVVAIGGAWALALAAFATGREHALHGASLTGHGPPLWGAVLLFLLAWQAMIAAMMLPSSLPLVRLFGAAAARQERPGPALAAFLGGYAVLWSVFGLLAFVGDAGIHRAVDAVPSLALRPWLLGGVALVLAGAFQFSGLKDRCLQKCRQPGPFLLAHYKRGARGGFELGARHGVFCLGCCWALMLVMFVSGVAMLWWMAALTALMVYEKVGRHGVVAARAAGVGLLASGTLLLVHPIWLPSALGGPRAFAADTTVGPGPVTHVFQAGRYRVDLGIASNRLASTGAVSARLTRNGRPVDGARVRTTFTMLDMDMGRVSVQLPRTAPGRYEAPGPVLTMVGRWGLRLDITPRGAAPLALNVVDQVVP